MNLNKTLIVDEIFYLVSYEPAEIQQFASRICQDGLDYKVRVRILDTQSDGSPGIPSTDPDGGSLMRESPVTIKCYRTDGLDTSSSSSSSSTQSCSGISPGCQTETTCTSISGTSLGTLDCSDNKICCQKN